jgi:putative spermidine/putrescine transport system permease protein
MRSDPQRAPILLQAAAAAGLFFMLAPIALIFLYAFSSEERTYQWPPPGLTLKWFEVTWNRPDVWQALTLSVQVASIATAIALVLGTLCARRPSLARNSSAARRSRCS